MGFTFPPGSTNIMPNVIFGKAVYNNSKGKVLDGDLVEVTDLRDASGPLAAPEKYVVPARYILPIHDDQVAFMVSAPVAEINAGAETSTADYAYVAVVQRGGGGGREGFYSLALVEALETKGWFTNGSMYIIPERAVFYTKNPYYGYARVNDPIQDPNFVFEIPLAEVL